MRYSRGVNWTRLDNLERQRKEQGVIELQNPNSALPYYNKPINNFGRIGSCAHGKFPIESLDIEDFTGQSFLDNYNIKSPYNNQPISVLRRLLAVLTVLSVVMSGPSVLLEREPMTEEEQAALARAKKAVVDTIAEEGLVFNKMNDQSISYIRPATKVKETN